MLTVTFKDDELKRDTQLAMQIALAPPSPPHCVGDSIFVFLMEAMVALLFGIELELKGFCMYKIVDFDGKKRSANLVYGPMDKFVLRRRTVNVDNIDKLEDFSSRKYKGSYQVLIDRVWSYFSEHRPTESCMHCAVVEKMPLYFQHDGQSSTTVGVQVKLQRNGVKELKPPSSTANGAAVDVYIGNSR
ncbi:hypothetical protein Nepgr_010934 [Nepenthes gracilis]|uniref:Uncharacterized protein n=1 Tax=Nepenthes gracilis TaxID=150966 RepID=A0AAD3SEC3_NEPGR|nr:hypothetical protein Nepgr_010934 [Nepenthes gracilis]